MRIRFAPSPTGFLHVGSLRTALYAYLLAKHGDGKFILRIEDTDQKREVEGSTQAIQNTLKKFGLEWDEFYTQSDRLDLYKKAAERLVQNGHAFYCDCKGRNAKTEGFSIVLRDPCREKGLTSGAIKLKVPEDQLIKYTDFVHKKEIAWKSNTVYDATLLKSDGYPTYHLAVAVDDIDMKITHVLRGHDWLPSTPIHLLVFNYLGGSIPEIGHLTDILSTETGKKLSKRRDSVFVENFLEEGYLPEALLNFILLLGWAPKDNREIYTLEEMIKYFDINGFQDANPRFFREKLDWFNGQYIRKLSIDSLLEKLKLDDTSRNKSIVSLLQDRIEKLSDFNSLAGFFFDRPKVNSKLFGENYKEHLIKAMEGIKTDRDLMEIVKENNFKTGDFFMDLRIAITGLKFTPPINESIAILGKEEAIKRIWMILEVN